MAVLNRPRKIIFPNINLTNYKGILIDLDGTLYDYEWSHAKALTACYQCASWGKDSQKEWENKYRHHRERITDRLLPTGSCRSRLLAFQELLEEQYNHLPAITTAARLEQLYWESFLEAMSMDSSAKSLLVDASSLHNMQVCVVTDMQHIWQIKKLEKLDALKYVKYLVSSEIVGVEKPDQKIFKYALNKMELEPSEVAMIGDNLEKDIIGAKALGIDTYLVQYEK